MNAFDLLSESVKYLSHIMVRQAEKYWQRLGLFLAPGGIFPVRRDLTQISGDR